MVIYQSENTQKTCGSEIFKAALCSEVWRCLQVFNCASIDLQTTSNVEGGHWSNSPPQGVGLEVSFYHRRCSMVYLEKEKNNLHECAVPYIEKKYVTNFLKHEWKPRQLVQYVNGEKFTGNGR